MSLHAHTRFGSWANILKYGACQVFFLGGGGGSEMELIWSLFFIEMDES